MSKKLGESVFVCRECQSGKMTRQFVAYVTWIGNELITVPDFPAWVCDVCGRCEYDGYALNRLSLILSPTAGRSPARSRPRTEPSSRKGTRPDRS